MPETYDATQFEVLVRKALYTQIVAVATAQACTFIPPELEKSEDAKWVRPTMLASGIAPSRAAIYFASPIFQVDVFIRKIVPENWITNTKIAEAFRKAVHKTKVELQDSTEAPVGWLTFFDADLTYLGIDEVNHHWMIEVRGQAQIVE